MDGYRDQIVTMSVDNVLMYMQCDVGLSLHSKIHVRTCTSIVWYST